MKEKVTNVEFTISEYDRFTGRIYDWYIVKVYTKDGAGNISKPGIATRK
jgi:hypothetical protein